VQVCDLYESRTPISLIFQSTLQFDGELIRFTLFPLPEFIAERSSKGPMVVFVVSVLCAVMIPSTLTVAGIALRASSVSAANQAILVEREK
jgi:hypothetical protein